MKMKTPVSAAVYIAYPQIFSLRVGDDGGPDTRFIIGRIGHTHKVKLQCQRKSPQNTNLILKRWKFHPRDSCIGSGPDYS